MRVRPFYWILFSLCCIGVLLFAATEQETVPALLHVGVEQHITPMTVLTLHLTDEQGLPIENAIVQLHADMPAMHMATPSQEIIEQQGVYWIRLHLDMAGLWTINISARATGFVIPRQTLSVQVEQSSSASLPSCLF
jgi:hypothetical protein